MFHFLLTTGFMFIAPENVASLHSPSEKTKASYQTKARMGKVSLSIFGESNFIRFSW